jgi:hypothetical protein
MTIAAAVVILIGILWLALRNPVPDLHGLTIDEANARLAENPKFVLGKQVGFVEPDRSKGKLLGKIAEQILVEKENEPTVMDYKLYQIDVSKIDQYMTGTPGEIGLMDSSDMQERMNELRMLAKELAALREEPVAEPIPLPPPPPVVEKRRRSKKRTVTFSELSFGAPKTTRNRLGFSVPDRPSSSRVHKSKESFFW